MITNSGQTTATIYQFPIGGRAAFAAGKINSTDFETASSTQGTYVLTDAWYHEEALRESRQASKQ